MFRGLYLLSLLGAMGGLVILDMRFRLVLRRNARRAGLLLAAGLLFFLAWDLVGIHERVFYVGDGRVLSGIQLAPQLPLEEPIFLLLLMYQTLIAWEMWGRWRER